MTEEREEFYDEMEMFGYDTDAFWALMECIELAEDYCQIKLLKNN